MPRRVVVELRVSDEFYRFVRENNYGKTLCDFFEWLIREAGAEFGVWFIFPAEDIRIKCSEEEIGRT